MRSVTVTEDGDLIIPRDVVERRGLRPGDQVHIFDFELGGQITLVPFAKDLKATRGMVKGGPSLTAELLEDRRQEREWERQRMEQRLQREREVDLRCTEPSVEEVSND